MARIFITGSTDGIGFLAAESLMKDGHAVVLHARNDERAVDVMARLPAATDVVTGDLSQITQIRRMAEQANELRQFDAVIHNAGIFTGSQQGRMETIDGLPTIIAVNVLAPYLLTALINRPKRLIFLSSSMHFGASSDLSDLEWKRRRWNNSAAYSQSKLCVVMLALAVARYWPDVFSNAVDPGWVPTKMGGSSATDDLYEGFRTQAWLAVSHDESSMVSGKYFFHRQQQQPDNCAMDIQHQDELMALCGKWTGVSLAYTKK